MSISTHVLDTATGQPAAGIRVQLFFDQKEIGSGVTNQDGRIAALTPAELVLRTGVYRLEFETGGYFPQSFYPMVSITFAVSQEVPHYHVPLLISPFGYTTYRGS